ncbi:DUF6248 family natural product biosynthesis protein [Amycolatopsis kentuckyensis]|uniref:DUF6248 family natural product biosynthesis protein n=1 Tax=Amycolatopsis kentuckyensis TaxID=218823 RepID=UPI003569C079
MLEPLPPMSEEDAAWIRDKVWPRKLRAAYRQAAKRGGNLNACRCQLDTSWHCENGMHKHCHPEDTWDSPETKILRADGETPAKLPGFGQFHDRYTGELRDRSDVPVWLADRVCKFTCSCDCVEHHEEIPYDRTTLNQYKGYAIDADEVFVDGQPNEVRIKVNGVRVASAYGAMYWEPQRWFYETVNEIADKLDRSCLPEHWKPLRDPEAMKTIQQVSPPAWLPEGPNVGDVVEHPEHGRCEVLWAHDRPKGRLLDLHLIYDRSRQSRYRLDHVQVGVAAADVAVLERAHQPRPPMSEEDAAWIRDTVWPKQLRAVHASAPKFHLRCACQYGVTGHCASNDGHEECQFAKPDATPQRSSETWITRKDGTVINGAEVWLADRVCRWSCPCECGHKPPKKKRKAKRRTRPALPAPKVAQAPAPRPKAKVEQLSLFG